VIDECLHVQQRAFQASSRDIDSTKSKTSRSPKSGVSRFSAITELSARKRLLNFSAKIAKPFRVRRLTNFSRRSTTARRITFGSAGKQSGRFGSPLLRFASGKLSEYAAEIILPISHFLIGCPGAKLDEIEIVESHPVALSQCEKFFSRHPQISALRRTTRREACGA
jgi:hypothetical protein